MTFFFHWEGGTFHVLLPIHKLKLTRLNFMHGEKGYNVALKPLHYKLCLITNLTTQVTMNSFNTHTLGLLSITCAFSEVSSPMLEGSRYWIGPSSKLGFGVSKLEGQNFCWNQIKILNSKSSITETKIQNLTFHFKNKFRFSSHINIMV
jgi:hypothetical protein